MTGDPLEAIACPTSYVFYEADVVPIGPDFVKVEGNYYLNLDAALARDWADADEMYRAIHCWVGNLYAICQEHDPAP